MTEERQRVFAFSLGDVFEDRRDLDQWRSDFFDLVKETPNLDWMILTKRHEYAAKWIGEYEKASGKLFKESFPNVWLGVSAENQKQADRRIPTLLKLSVAIRFVSIEPMLGPVDLRSYDAGSERGLTLGHDWLTGDEWSHSDIFGGGSSYLGKEEKEYYGEARLDLVIVGGESGNKARGLMNPNDVRALRNQCVETGTHFFFKQWGQFAPIGAISRLSISPLPKKHVWFDNNIKVFSIGKRKAGRILDGLTWSEMPSRKYIEKRLLEKQREGTWYG